MCRTRHARLTENKPLNDRADRYSRAIKRCCCCSWCRDYVLVLPHVITESQFFKYSISTAHSEACGRQVTNIEQKDVKQIPDEGV